MENNNVDMTLYQSEIQKPEYIPVDDSTQYNSSLFDKGMEILKKYKEEQKHNGNFNKFPVFVKDNVDWIYNDALGRMVNFDSKESVNKYLEERYKKDKIKYLLTGKWPNVRFYYRDSSWMYYYYLQVKDPEVKLKKYFDFDYYSPDWPREKIVELIEKYDIGIIFQFCLYSDSNSNMSFEDWYYERIRKEKSIFDGKSYDDVGMVVSVEESAKSVK